MNDLQTLIIGDPSICSPAEIAELVNGIEETGVTLVSTYVSIGTESVLPSVGPTTQRTVSMLFGIFRKNTSWAATVPQSAPFKPETKSLDAQEG